MPLRANHLGAKTGNRTGGRLRNKSKVKLILNRKGSQIYKMLKERRSMQITIIKSLNNKLFKINRKRKLRRLSKKLMSLLKPVDQEACLLRVMSRQQ